MLALCALPALLVAGPAATASESTHGVVARQPQATFTVTVKSLAGTTWPVTGMSTSSTVLQLKEGLYETQGIPTCQQTLVYKGMVMANARTLGSYGITGATTVNVVIQPVCV